MVFLDYEPMEEYTQFCGDLLPHEKHDNEGTAEGAYFVSTCPGVDDRLIWNTERDMNLDEEREVDNDCVE